MPDNILEKTKFYLEHGVPADIVLEFIGELEEKVAIAALSEKRKDALMEVRNVLFSLEFLISDDEAIDDTCPWCYGEKMHLSNCVRQNAIELINEVIKE